MVGGLFTLSVLRGAVFRDPDVVYVYIYIQIISNIYILGTDKETTSLFKVYRALRAIFRIYKITLGAGVQETARAAG